MSSVGDRLECKRCGHSWHARLAGRPVQCPRCKSPAWDRDTRVRETMVEYRPTSKYGKEKTASPKGRGSVRPSERKFGNWSRHPSFGIWADRKETDEELLTELRRGWGDPKKEG